jgi:hypothetical protein
MAVPLLATNMLIPKISAPLVTADTAIAKSRFLVSCEICCDVYTTGVLDGTACAAVIVAISCAVSTGGACEGVEFCTACDFAGVDCAFEGVAGAVVFDAWVVRGVTLLTALFEGVLGAGVACFTGVVGAGVLVEFPEVFPEERLSE